MQARQILLGLAGASRSASVLLVLLHQRGIVRRELLRWLARLGHAGPDLVCCSARRDITGPILMIPAMCTGVKRPVYKL